MQMIKYGAHGRNVVPLIRFGPATRPSRANHSTTEPLRSLYRRSYMCAHVLLNLLNELRKRHKLRGFRNELNKFNNTRARMLDSIYHMTR